MIPYAPGVLEDPSKTQSKAPASPRTRETVAQETRNGGSTSNYYERIPGQIAEMKANANPAPGMKLAGNVFKDSKTHSDRQIARDLIDMSQKGQDAAVVGILTGKLPDQEQPVPAEPEVETETETKPDPTIPTLPNQDAAGTLSGMNSNLVKGVGDYLGRASPPAPPKPKVAEFELMDAEGKQTVFDMNKIPKWQESDAFYGGLLSMGLNLLSGNDLATSFNAAGTYFDDAFGREKREIWAQDLVDQGYDAQDIQRWIQTGDNQDLKDPFEKKMRAQQYNLGQQALSEATYKNSPEMRQNVLDQQSFDNNMKVAQLQHSIDASNASLQMQRAQLNFQMQKAKEAEKTKYNANSNKMFMSGALMTSVNPDDLIYTPTVKDYGVMATASKLPKSAQEAFMQQFAPQYHAFNQARNQMSEMIGRALSGAALSEYNERPIWANSLMPTQAEIERNDVKAFERKANLRAALISYAETVAEGQEGSINLSDLTQLTNGSAEMLVDENGISRAIKYRNGEIKNL